MTVALIPSLPFEAVRGIDAVYSGLQSGVQAVGTALSASTTQLLADVIVIGSCSRNSNDGVQLRSYVSGNRTQTVINRSGSLAVVYPPTGGFIGYSATNIGYSLADQTWAQFTAVGAKEYWAFPKGA